ncbi:uncharacterized protein B0H18DRAFT_684458 [Fomitopsis serialis]|uniref:uncharacterized protein n=1 Tax=Fomitopsis serialis TaxID=139415 RepID=UPI00200784C6|nr:uncharacterized protein B0H18DRAFT_684458 [Neoantrodia serialis]KAH9918008.1 hypothetical protein B0H18DRAFT_684458 [Neoantrodia serialis]
MLAVYRIHPAGQVHASLCPLCFVRPSQCFAGLGAPGLPYRTRGVGPVLALLVTLGVCSHPRMTTTNTSLSQRASGMPPPLPSLSSVRIPRKSLESFPGGVRITWLRLPLSWKQNLNSHRYVSPPYHPYPSFVAHWRFRAFMYLSFAGFPPLLVRLPHTSSAIRACSSSTLDEQTCTAGTRWRSTRDVTRDTARHSVPSLMLLTTLTLSRRSADEPQPRSYCAISRAVGGFASAMSMWSSADRSRRALARRCPCMDVIGRNNVLVVRPSSCIQGTTVRLVGRPSSGQSDAISLLWYDGERGCRTERHRSKLWSTQPDELAYATFGVPSYPEAIFGMSARRRTRRVVRRYRRRRCRNQCGMTLPELGRLACHAGCNETIRMP